MWYLYLISYRTEYRPPHLLCTSTTVRVDQINQSTRLPSPSYVSNQTHTSFCALLRAPTFLAAVEEYTVGFAFCFSTVIEASVPRLYYTVQEL